MTGIQTQVFTVASLVLQRSAIPSSVNWSETRGHCIHLYWIFILCILLLFVLGPPKPESCSGVVEAKYYYERRTPIVGIPHDQPQAHDLAISSIACGSSHSALQLSLLALQKQVLTNTNNDRIQDFVIWSEMILATEVFNYPGLMNNCAQCL